MASRKLSSTEIVDRLHIIDGLVADGQAIADALQFAGVLPAEYEKWRSEYAGLLRTLGPLASAPPYRMKNPRRAGSPARSGRSSKLDALRATSS